MRRQLLSPKPSASARVIFLLPHHDGAPATCLLLAAFDDESESELDPQAATVTARTAAASAAPAGAYLRCICTPLSGDFRAALPRPLAHSPPGDAVDGD